MISSVVMWSRRDKFEETFERLIAALGSKGDVNDDFDDVR